MKWEKNLSFKGFTDVILMNPRHTTCRAEKKTFFFAMLKENGFYWVVPTWTLKWIQKKEIFFMTGSCDHVNKKKEKTQWEC